MRSKNTAVISIRIDVRTLASLALYEDAMTGRPEKSYPALFRDAVADLFAGISEDTRLYAEKKVGRPLKVETIEEATQILDRLNYATPNTSGRGRKQLTQQANLEQVTLDLDGPGLDL